MELGLISPREMHFHPPHHTACFKLQGRRQTVYSKFVLATMRPSTEEMESQGNKEMLCLESVAVHLRFWPLFGKDRTHRPRELKSY